MATQSTFTLELITPECARKYLQANTQNRKLRKNHVGRLAQIIRNNQWQITHQGIAFDPDGTLIDGQHRLNAIVLADLPVQMWVCRGLSRQSLFALDQGATRQAHDIAGAVGLGYTWVTDKVTQVARSMMIGADQFSFELRSQATSQNVISYCVKHGEAIRFSIDHLSSGRLKVASVRAVVARAWYTVDHDRLAEFCICLKTSMVTNKRDQPAAALLSNVANKPNDRFTLYNRTEYALSAFVAERPISRVQMATSELFPVPGEKG